MPASVPHLLIAGHVTCDQFDDGERLGGAAGYAARTAAVLGVPAGLVTAAPPGHPLVDTLTGLAGVDTACRPSATITTFSLDYRGPRRRLRCLATATPLDPGDVPSAWRRAPVAYVAPVAGECSRALVEALDSFVVLGLQGWLRRIGPGGEVEPAIAPEAVDPPRGARAAVLSEEDHPDAGRLSSALAARGLIVALTRGAAGATLFARGGVVEVPASPARELDPTGAGDVFGVVLGLALAGGAEPVRAAALAAGAAARVVEGPALGRLSDWDPAQIRPFLKRAREAPI
jgi:sugar/nucleoside kinase (ribokinase family)